MDIKAYIVNLARRTDRRAEMEKQLADARLPFACEFVPAVDGRDLAVSGMAHTFQAYPKWRIPGSNHYFYGRSLRTGEIACSLSHHAVWERARAEGHRYALVLEDDAALVPDFWVVLQGRLQDLKDHRLGWDLLYVGRSQRPRTESMVLDGLVVPGFSYGTLGYLLTQSGIEKLLAAGLRENVIPSDEFLASFYCDHPRTDIQQLYRRPQSFSAYAILPGLVCERRPECDAEGQKIDSDVEGSAEYAQLSELDDAELRLNPHPSLSFVIFNNSKEIVKVETKVLGIEATLGAEAALVLSLLQGSSTPIASRRLQTATGLDRRELHDLLRTLLQHGVVEQV
jgi:GR25 family glycosyltransferase involved in LPS biosynthesis